MEIATATDPTAHLNLIDPSTIVEATPVGVVGVGVGEGDSFDDQIAKLEEQVVTHLDNFKLSSNNTKFEDYKVQLAPMIEFVAHRSMNIAQSAVQASQAMYRQRLILSNQVLKIEEALHILHERVCEGILYPILLEVAQSEVYTRRCAALYCFQMLYREYGQGSFLDRSVNTSFNVIHLESQILSYWMNGSIACLLPGAFSSDTLEASLVSKALLGMNSLVRPLLKCIAQLITSAEDTQATSLFKAFTNLLNLCISKFLDIQLASSINKKRATNPYDDTRGVCIKIFETVIVCMSSRELAGLNLKKRRGQETTSASSFAVQDLPMGHPLITRQTFEQIADYLLTIVKGLVEVGGQVKVEDLIQEDAKVGDPDVSNLLHTLQTTALAYLSVKPEKNDDGSYVWNRKDLDILFLISQKPFTIAINALSMIACNRPGYYKEITEVLSRRTIDKPELITGEQDGLNDAGIKSVCAQLKASCLTLLRNPLSVTLKGSNELVEALKNADMKIQAEKALSAAKQQAALQTASRAARNKAAIFYQWDQGNDATETKRKREEDMVSKMKDLKRARGLGNGIQLPKNMIEAIELVLLNLENIPNKRPPSAPVSGDPVDLDYIVDAVVSCGKTLRKDEGCWYNRNGGSSWTVHVIENDEEDATPTHIFEMNDVESKGEETEKTFQSQCFSATIDAFNRLVAPSVNSNQKNNSTLNNLRDQLSARMAWTLGKIQPTKKSLLGEALDAASEAVEEVEVNDEEGIGRKSFLKNYPLVSACLSMEHLKMEKETTAIRHHEAEKTPISLSNRILYEGYLQGDKDMYTACSNILYSSIALANKKSSANASASGSGRVATAIASSLPERLALAPYIDSSTLQLTASFCDVSNIFDVASEIAKKGTSTIAASAAANSSKVAAEKRATTSLLVLRDLAFQRTILKSQRAAVEVAVSLATGRLPSVTSVYDKALKLTMNVLYAKSEALADLVVECAMEELERSSDYAIRHYELVTNANDKELANKDSDAKERLRTYPLSPISDEEGKVMDKIKRSAVLFMALCARKPEIIKTLMKFSCREKADVLLKTVKAEMPKLARAASAAHGPASISLKIADFTTTQELPLLFAFLDNLCPSSASSPPSVALIEACLKIQKNKAIDGKKDPRFIIPVVSGIKRADLLGLLANFVQSPDNVYKAALVRMSERLSSKAGSFRDETSPDTEPLLGMSLCEQLVYLHNLQFAKLGIPQKRYLEAIKICLDDENLFNNRIILAALDHISKQFLEGEKPLPLAYMRTIILTCQIHDTLHQWICTVLLPRLVEGKVYNDRRQWEGWMRCAKMLESGNSGASSVAAINSLPPDQLAMYRTKYARG